MSFIYKITNKLNNKMYIGFTDYEDPNERWIKHLRDLNREDYENRPLYRAIKKYGQENFIFEVIEETDSPIKREEYYIQYYDTYNNGYNATLGGDGRKRLFSTIEKIEELIKVYNETDSIKKTAEIIGHDEAIVAKKLKELGMKIHNYKGKPVLKIDKETNKILAYYPSASEAARELGNVALNSKINEVCRGKRKTTYGFKWEYAEE